MKKTIAKLEAASITVHEYKEGKKLSGYELNTYSNGGVNQIVFVDFRDTNKNPRNAQDFKEALLQRINDTDIDEEIETLRQDKSYKQAFTLSEALEDLTEWKNRMLEVANSL